MFLHDIKRLDEKYKKGGCYVTILLHLKKFEPPKHLV
jgi:hypothetical protein